ncbi:MAG: MBL fold metallo-hydrolase [Burkholderiaceae bacterium]
MNVEGFFDSETSSLSYLVFDEPNGHCALIDSVLDYDSAAGRTSTVSADRLVSRVRELGLRVDWILETHVHADHLSAAPYLKSCLGGQIGIGSNIVLVQQVFGDLFNAESSFLRDGSQFDRRFEDNDKFHIGKLEFSVIHTPGHTPACATYVFSDAKQSVAFVGDTLFMPDYGTARCDFPGGDARTLYRSISRILSLPASTLIYVCHDYQPGGRDMQYQTTVAEQREHNIHVHDGVTEDEFVAMREKRDATLSAPRLILPSVQVNMRAGRLPEPESNGTRYLKIPIDRI